MASHNDLGKEGELIAFHFLKESGFNIVATNWRWQKAEVDLVIQEEETVVFVEVKTRSSNKYGSPMDAITPKKQLLLQDAAEAYLAEHQLDLEIRFDAISIILDEKEGVIEHIKNAF